MNIIQPFLLQRAIRKMLLLLVVLLYHNMPATAQKKSFITVYLSDAAKAQGFYTGSTDSALIISIKNVPDTIYYKNITQIVTKRSRGHDILIGALIGTAAGTATGLIAHKDAPPSDPDCGICPVLNDLVYNTKGEDAAIGAAFGALAGTAAGAVIGFTKKKLTLIVNGNFKNLKLAEQQLGALPQQQ